MTSQQEVVDLVERSLEELRPYLRADGGDITLKEVTDDLRVLVELHGACSNCSMSLMTMKAGVEEAIRKAIPNVLSVEAVNLPDPSEAPPSGR